MGALSTATVALLAIQSLGRTSPGTLTSVHGIEAELSGASDCSSCHGGFLATMTEACLECHEPIASDLDSGKGLHGILAKGAASTCARCHSEHHGPSFEITNRKSFLLAGAECPEDFDHTLVGLTMEDEHLELECSECHVNADVKVLPRGELRFMGLEWSCANCHDDPHEGRMVIDCASCHGEEAFDVYEAPGHGDFLPLVGVHDLACAECHEPDGQWSLEATGSGNERLVRRACADCHESPHAWDFVANVAELAAVRRAASCDTCHPALEHASFEDERVDVTPEQHAASGFALAAPHDEVECAQCHAPELGDFAERYPGRAADDCAKCHDDPHGGQFADGPFAEPTCVACHGREQFEPHFFTEEEHASAALPLTERHAEVECNVCHAVPAPEAPRVFRGTPNRCELCHTDAHDGFFDARGGAELAALEQGTCARCHDSTSFSTVLAERFDHGEWTGFPIEGAHVETECTDCHTSDALPDEHGRTFGRIRTIHAGFQGCVTCHADPHGGLFDAPELASAIEGRTDCARCHTETSFESLRIDFAHGIWTGYELEDAHAAAECTACHAPLPTPDELGRTLSRARGTQCADCHDDPHAGQFRVSGRTDCTRCHPSATSFEDGLDFDHERDSRFALGRAHRNLACSQCHAPWPIEGGSTAVRYRPLRMECTDCHGAHHEQGRSGERKKR